MRLVACVLVLAAACSTSTKLVGERCEVEVPAGWRVAADDVPAMFRAIRDPTDHRRGIRPWILVTDAQPRGLPAIAIYELVDPAPPKRAPLPVPQAELMGTAAIGVVVGAPTIESCQGAAERLGLAVRDPSVIKLDGVSGCELLAPDGQMRTRMFAVGGGIAIVSCKRDTEADPALQRGCDRIVRTLRPKQS